MKEAAMHRLAAMIGSLPILVAGGTLAQPAPNTGGTVQSPGVIYPGTTAPSEARQPPPVFSLGNLPVFIWAPVEAPNNQSANRNLNADPVLPNSPAWFGEPG
jgi:hypothetical protein